MPKVWAGVYWAICVAGGFPARATQEMKPLKRMCALAGVITLAGLFMAASRGPGLKYLLEPLTLILVLGLTVVLGVLTYDPQRLGAEFGKFFSRKTRTNTANKRMLAQLALYALVSGIILAVMHVLLHFKGWDMAQKSAAGASQLASVRMPFLSLLYGVLTALGLWVTCSDAPESHEVDQPGKDPGIMSFLVLLLTVAVLAWLIAAMSLDQKRLAGVDRASADQLPSGSSGSSDSASQAGARDGKQFQLEAAVKEVPIKSVGSAFSEAWGSTEVTASTGLTSTNPTERLGQGNQAAVPSTVPVGKSKAADDSVLRWEVGVAAHGSQSTVKQLQ